MTTTGSQTPSTNASSTKPSTTVLLTAVAYFMVTLDTLVVVTALPSIHRSFGGGIATLQWTVSAYTIAFGAGILTAAALGDRLGRRRVYVVGLALFTAASAACALAPDANLLIAFRAIQGIGAAIVMPLSLTILTSAFPIEKRGAVVGIWGGIAGVAVAAGPLIGGGITQALSWHWIFWVNVPIGVAATVGAALRLPESYGPRARLDVPALVLVSGGVAVLIWGLVQGGQNGWGTSQNLVGLFVGSGDARGLRLVGESGRRADDPAQPVQADLVQLRRDDAVLHGGGDLLGRLPDKPVLPVRPRKLPAWNRSALLAMDGNAARDRPHRRCALGPARRSRAHRAGSADAGVRLRVDGPPRDDVCPLHELHRSLRHCRRRHIDGAYPASPPAGSMRCHRISWERRREPSTRCSSSALSSGSPWSQRCSTRTGASPPPAAVTSGYRAALAVSAGASVLGALVALGIRRARAAGAGRAVEAEPEDEVSRNLAPIGQS